MRGDHAQPTTAAAKQNFPDRRIVMLAETEITATRERPSTRCMQN